MTDPPDPCDADVLTASVDEPAAFATIFDRHAPGVHRYLERRVGRDVADDLLGEVFRIAFERRQTFRPPDEGVPSPGGARPWLFGIATNLVLKAHRHETRRLRALARMPLAVTDGDLRLERVDESLDASVEVRAVLTAMSRLDRRDRDVVVLVAWEGFSYGEVAAALDIPVGTVRSRLNRARRQLRELAVSSGDERATIRDIHHQRRAVCE